MGINVIFDDRHSEDKDRLIIEFNRQGLQATEYCFWDAIVLPQSVVKSINASHKMIVQWAKDNKLKEVCIAEQDLTFPSERGWKYFMENKPSAESYDLYLGGTYIVPISNNKVCGLHLYWISEKFYDRFLSAPDDGHIDTCMDDLNGDYHYCYPFAALQRAGFSCNNGAIVDYNKNLKPEDIYG